MRKWKTRPGIVLTCVCDEPMLVATAEARGLCPYVKQLNSTGAYYWSLLEKGLGLEEMASEASAAYGVPQERILPGLEAYIKMLAEAGYLIPVDEG